MKQRSWAHGRGINYGLFSLKITDRTCPLDTNPEFECLVAEVVVQYDLYVVHPSKLHPVQHGQVVDVLGPITGGQDQEWRCWTGLWSGPPWSPSCSDQSRDRCSSRAPVGWRGIPGCVDIVILRSGSICRRTCWSLWILCGQRRVHINVHVFNIISNFCLKLTWHHIYRHHIIQY